MQDSTHTEVKTNTSPSAFPGELSAEQVVRIARDVAKIGVYRSYPLTEEMYCNEQFRQDFGIRSVTPHEIYLDFLNSLFPDDRERFLQYTSCVRRGEVSLFCAGEEVQNILLRVSVEGVSGYKYVQLFTHVEVWDMAHRRVVFGGVSKCSGLLNGGDMEPARLRSEEPSRFQLSFYQHLTDKKNIRRELHYKQALLNLALESARIQAFIFHFSRGQEYPATIYLYDNNPDNPLSFISKPWDQFLLCLHPEDQVQQAAVCDRLARMEVREFKTELRMQPDPAGRMEWYEVTGRIHEIDEAGQPVLLVGCYLNIEERKKYEDGLIRAREKAELADHMKSTYLANMSHEIRTPLNAIVGFSELLSFTEDPEEKQSYIDIIKTNNDQLLHLIGDILDLSKIEAGLLAVTYEQIDLNELMDEIYRSIRLKIPAHLSFRLEKGLASFLFVTDRSRLMQVITNLLNNAVKYTEQGGISFGYRKEEEQVIFYVSDTGTGMPAEKLERIFRRHVMLNQKKEGFGLGLAISKGIVEKFGGTIEVTSEEGKGSTFRFVLPVRPACG